MQNFKRMTQELGVLKSVDLRCVWRHEELDFTPWLALEENLALLGAAIDMDFVLFEEVVRQGGGV